MYNKVSRFLRKFFQENGRDPTSYEVSEHLKLPVDKVEVVMRLIKEPIPFDGKRPDEDENSKPQDIVPDDLISSTDEVLDSLERKDLCFIIRNILMSVLSSKERKVIEFRGGLSNGKEATLDEVSLQLNMTKERVRQIEQRAKQKLKKALKKIKPIIEGQVLIKNAQALIKTSKSKNK